MKEKIQFKSKQIISVEEESREIIDIALKRQIKLPSTHLGFFKTIYCEINNSNLNGIRLAKKAVEEALPGLILSQVNFSHLGAGFLCGTILDAWINEDNQIEVVYSFYKSIYPNEYEQSIELAKEGKLSVSFELLAERDTQENLEDGTILINDIDFQGMAHLMDESPACPLAKVKEFAKKTRERLSHIKDRELVCASVIEEACDEILSEEHPDENIEESILWTTITTRIDRHIHVIKIDTEGNGTSVGTFGDDEEPHEHEIMNYQIQKTKGHAHRILEELLAKRKEEIRQSVKEELDKHSDIIATEHPDRGDVIFPAESSKVKDGKDHFPINTIGQARNALARVAQFDSVPSWYDGTLSELIRKVKNAVKKKYPSINISIKADKKQGGVQFMTNEETVKIKALRDELGDFAKDIKDEDLLDDSVVAELRKEIEKTKADADEKDKEAGDGDKDEDESEADAGDSEAEAEADEGEAEADAEGGKAKADEKSEAKKAQDRITELEGKVEELENTLDAKNSEIETVRENAEKIGKSKVQLKDNKFTKDFKDEDYLDDKKVEKAIQDQKDSETVETRKEELKDNEYAKDFKDEDYLDDVKVELAQVKKEKDDLEAKKDKVDASKNKNDEAESDMNTGDNNSENNSYREVIASIRKDKKETSLKQKVYTR